MRMAVIGCGDMGKRHARVLSGMKDIDLVAVCDQNDIRADTLAEELGCDSIYEHYELWGEVDAAVVATNATRHFEVCDDLLSNDIHVLVEKPIAVTTEQAERMDEVARLNGMMLQVGHIERYNPAVKRMLSVISGMEAPFKIEAERLSVAGFRKFDVDVVLDLMIHDIDLFLSVARSPVKRVTASGTWDYALAEIELQDGTTATMRANRLAETRGRSWGINDERHFLITEHDSLKDELRDFIDCVREGRRPGAGAALDSLDVALEASRQIREGYGIRP